MKAYLGISLLALALAGACAAPAQADSGGHGAAPKGAGAPAARPEIKPADPLEVALPPVIVPVLRGRDLAGYLYLDVALRAPDEAGAGRLRENMPLLQDAALRCVNAAPIPAETAEDPGTKDVLTGRLRAALGQLGGLSLQSVSIRGIQSAPF